MAFWEQTTRPVAASKRSVRVARLASQGVGPDGGRRWPGGAEHGGDAAGANSGNDQDQRTGTI